MKRYTLFSSAVAAARCALLKGEVVWTLRTTVFTELMKEAGKLVRANQDATQLTDIARNVNDALVQQKAEARFLLLEKAPEVFGSATALEAICMPTGGAAKLSGSTAEKAYPGIRKAQRTTHSGRTLATKLAGVLPTELLHFMIDGANAVNVRCPGWMSTQVVGERQVNGRLAEDQRLARCGVGAGHVKQGCPRNHHLRQTGQNDEGS